MKASRLTWLLPFLSASAWAQQTPRDTHPDTSYVGVVIGLSTYKNLPESVELKYARSDAATVAEALRMRTGYDRVFGDDLLDRSASREAIVKVLREEAPQYLGPRDVLVLYFAGHGVGSDLGLPALLAYDSTLENAHVDGFEMEAFARDVALWTNAGTTLIVTDAIHKNNLDSIFFYGPSAQQWPGIGPGVMVISSSSTNEPAGDGVFGIAFADAMSGAADLDADEKITAAELQQYLTDRLASSGQTPMFAGSYPADMVLAEGVVPGSTFKDGAKIIDEAAFVVDDVRIDAAKFVFRDGTAATVTCQTAEPKLCDSTCYVRDFNAGLCQLSAVVEGRQVKGNVLAMYPGKYDCGLRADGSLSCLRPHSPSSK